MNIEKWKIDVVKRLADETKEANRILKSAALRGEKWQIQQQTALIDQKADEIKKHLEVS